MEPEWVEDEVEFAEPTPHGGQEFHSIAADAIVPILSNHAPTFSYGAQLAQPVEPMSEESYHTPAPNNAKKTWTPTPEDWEVKYFSMDCVI